MGKIVTDDGKLVSEEIKFALLEVTRGNLHTAKECYDWVMSDTKKVPRPTEDDVPVHLTDKGFNWFEHRCRLMNDRYELPTPLEPTVGALGEPMSERLVKFKRILKEELEEIDEIILKAQAFESGNNYAEPEGGKTRPVDELELLTDIADLMVDLQVYEVSEMVKFGLPLGALQDVVMDSNESKLWPDGTVKKDANGKFQKGPGYWKPEPAIRALIERRREKVNEFNEHF